MPEPEYSDDYLDPRLAILYDRMNPGCDDTDHYVEPMMAAGAVLDVGCAPVEVVGRFTSPAWDREILCPSRFRFVDADALDGCRIRGGRALRRVGRPAVHRRRGGDHHDRGMTGAGRGGGQPRYAATLRGWTRRCRGR